MDILMLNGLTELRIFNAKGGVNGTGQGSSDG